MELASLPLAEVDWLAAHLENANAQSDLTTLGIDKTIGQPFQTTHDIVFRLLTSAHKGEQELEHVDEVEIKGKCAQNHGLASKVCTTKLRILVL